MWFIIIFGSLPTIRTVFITAGQHMRSLTGTAKPSKHRSKGYIDQSWVELSHDRNKGFETKVDTGRRVGLSQYGRSDSEEEILSDGRRNIMVTTDMEVRSTSR